VEYTADISEMRHRLAQCFLLVFPDLQEPDVYSSSSASVAAWDSTACIILANTIEEEFHIQLDYEVLPGLDSFDLILDCLKRKVHGSKSQIQFERNESTKKCSA
jgi:acyl carrier protein